MDVAEDAAASAQTQWARLQAPIKNKRGGRGTRRQK
jgi:hypothetical protein